MNIVSGYNLPWRIPLVRGEEWYSGIVDVFIDNYNFIVFVFFS